MLPNICNVSHDLAARIADHVRDDIGVQHVAQIGRKMSSGLLGSSLMSRNSSVHGSIVASPSNGRSDGVVRSKLVTLATYDSLVTG